MSEGLENTLWVEKYRPQTIGDMILPDDVMAQFKGFVKAGEIPNLIFSSVKAGVGKTTAARCLSRDLGYDMLMINSSLEANMDVLRNKMTTFVTTVSLSGNKKCILLDESDGLNGNVQAALRAWLEKFSGHCRFIFTCNYISKLLPPLVSRCNVVDFNFPQASKADQFKKTLLRLFYILDNEKIKYSKQAVALLLKKYYPDIRHTINDLQGYSIGGEIDEGILVSSNHGDFEKLTRCLKQKQFTEMRKWVAENHEVSSETIFRWFFDHACEIMSTQSVPQCILTTADYMYKSAFVADQEINNTAFLTELMSQCEFKA